MAPIKISIIAPIPEGWGLCATCESVLGQAEIFTDPSVRNMEAFPPDWIEDYQKLSSAIDQLAKLYGEQILIEVIDHQSLQGILKAIRHRISHNPAFIVEGWGKVEGLKLDEVEGLLAKCGCQKLI